MLVQKDQQWSIVEALAERAVPPGIMMTIRQRLMQLSPACLDHLHVAALIGRTFDLSLLASVQGQASEAVEEYILEAMRAQLATAEATARRENLLPELAHTLTLIYRTY